MVLLRGYVQYAARRIKERKGVWEIMRKREGLRMRAIMVVFECKKLVLDFSAQIGNA